MTVRTEDFTLVHFCFEFCKPDFSPETTYSEQLIFALFMMEIKDARILYVTSSAPCLLLVVAQPGVVFFYESLFR